MVSGTYEKPQLGKLELLQGDENFALGTFDNYFLTYWQREVTLQSTMEWARAINNHHLSMPEKKIGTLLLLHRSCACPIAPSVQSYLAESMGRARSWLGATAVAYAGEGFWSATMRSHVMAIHADSKANIPYTMVPSLEAAATWLVATMNDSTPVRVAALCHAFEDLRRERRAVVVTKR